MGKMGIMSSLIIVHMNVHIYVYICVYLYFFSYRWGIFEIIYNIWRCCRRSFLPLNCLRNCDATLWWSLPLICRRTLSI